MKTEKKNEARELRKLGLSLKEIAKRICVAKSSVSIWVRDIPLTNEQKQKLSPFARGRENTKDILRAKGITSRLVFQNMGREMAKKFSNDKDFIAGCIMYWAEGGKDKNVASITNSDIDVQKLFVRFLQKYFAVEPERFSVYCRYYTDLSHQGEPEKYWISSLGLPESCLRKSCVNYYPKDNTVVKKRYSHGKLKYGVSSVRTCSTEIVQKIYGAIQELMQIEKSDWVG